MTLRHLESSAFIDASQEDVFAFVNDHARFSSHMNESTWMMGGGRLCVELDEAKGQAVGSHIRLSGRVFWRCPLPRRSRHATGSANQQGRGDGRRTQVARHRRVLNGCPDHA